MVTVARGSQVSRAVAATSCRRQLTFLRSFSVPCPEKFTLTRTPMYESARRGVLVRATGQDEEKKTEVAYNREFGYSRKDVILIGSGLIGGGFLLKWALEAAGVDPIMSGNYAQLIIFVGLCFGWVGSYLFRVATKQMTYATQLEDYENAVMAKRLEEMPEAEIEELMASIEDEKQRRGGQ